MVPCEAHGTIRTVHTTYAAALKITTHQKTRCRKPYAGTQQLMFLWWVYVPETCRAKNTSITLHCRIKLAFHFIPWGRCTVKQPSKFDFTWSFTGFFQCRSHRTERRIRWCGHTDTCMQCQLATVQDVLRPKYIYIYIYIYIVLGRKQLCSDRTLDSNTLLWP